MVNEENKQTDGATGTAAAEVTKLTTEIEQDAEEETASSEMDFGAILEQFEQEQTAFAEGELVTGKIVGISERGVLVSFGYKSEGLVNASEFGNEGEINAKIGDDIQVVIKSIDEGMPILSFSEASARRSWDDLEVAFKDETAVKGVVTDTTKGGLKVDINGVEAFLPGSQIDSRPIRNLDSFVGQEIEARIIKFSKKRANVVLSRKVIIDEVVNAQKVITLARIDEGYVVDGVIKSLTEYGAFVDLGGIDGLLHVTDMSWGKLQNPGSMFKLNDHVQVKILKFDREKERVSLGYKQLLPDPWASVTERYKVGTTIKGKISTTTDYGAFVELEPGVEGLVHVSEMSWSKRSKTPRQLVKNGEEIECQVLGIDTKDRRISLGMKQLQTNPWDTIHERYNVGSKVTGKVRNLTDFGAFIEIEDGVDGLVHVSDISWSKRVKQPKEMLKRGQEVEAVITKIDSHERRLSLSIKDLAPSVWDAFVDSHKPGDVVKGKITRFANFGVFVELGEELEGLCHISELSDERTENPEADFQVGQELDFKILRIEHDVRKIGLSARAVGKEDEPVIDTKSYTTEAKGGMASLGELANLFNKQSDEK